MFWRFGGYANISTLDTILDKPDVTLDELLDEADLIQELKAQNAKLVEFLREDQILQRLLRYVIATKPPETKQSANHSTDTPPIDEKKTSGGFFKRPIGRSISRDPGETDADKAESKRLRYAYVACEILSSEVYSIYESLLACPQHLREFWEFVKTEEPLDALQAGYFTKINEALLEKKTEDMVAFIKTLDNVVADMMHHVDCPMVMDLLLKLISLEKESEGQGIVDWLQAQDLIPMLLSYITPNHPPATQTSAGDFLKAIITISANATGQDASVIGPNELTRQLVSEHCVNNLVENMLRGGNPLTVGVGIVIEVIRKNNSDYDAESQTGPEPKSSDPIYLGTLLRIFADHISDFTALILSPKHAIVTESGPQIVERKHLKVAWGEKIEPLGFDRFKTCELMAELLHCSNMGLLNEKGSDAAVTSRDMERERLKAEGKLASAQQPQSAQDGFGTSLDSFGFHHPDPSAPLGESPENIKRLEVQNIADEEGFEKVAMSEGLTGSDQSNNPLNTDNNEPDEDSEMVTEKLEEMSLNAEPSSNPENQSSSKRPFSLLTQLFQSNKEAALSISSDSTGAEKPAPLFSSRQTAQAASEQPSEPHDIESTEQPHEDSRDVDALSSSTQSVTQPGGSQSPLRDRPAVEIEDDGSPVVGDLLKMKFVEHKVVPTILDFFFRFPWNNFLHNVVYDVVQQVFNGSMDRGYNRALSIDLFDTGRITRCVVEGQQRSDKAQEEKKMRLGYMGHLTLIAEEVVKFTERQPVESLSQIVVDSVTDADWTYYVENVLTETRDRDNAILGGVRPDVAGGPRQAILNAVNAAQGAFGNSGSNALANAGLTMNTPNTVDSMDLAQVGMNPGNLLSGFGNSDDEDDDDIEEGELAEGGLLDQHGGADDDQAKDSDPSDPSGALALPAPLAVPPSRARRQLAVRLAEKQRLATTDPSTDSPEDIDADDEESGLSSSASPSHANNSATLSPSRPTHKRLDGENSSGDIESSARAGVSAEEFEDEPAELDGALRRQTTREAVERQPLDVSDDDDEDELDNVEDYWRIGEGRAATTQREGASDGGAAARQREQERILQQWGLADADDESSEEEEDAPVEMGTKFLKRSS